MIDESTSPMALADEHALPQEPPEPDPVAEADRAAAAEAELIPPKIRTGGMHLDLYPGEVGPCTRCGYVWTPSAATLARRSDGIPKRCANCRTDSWQDPPLSDRARQPGDKEFLLRRDTIVNRKRRRQVARFKELASELGVEVLNEPPPKPKMTKPPEPPPVIPAAADMSPPHPWQRRTRAIPPPPGMEEEKR